jgi:hypothetical protein
MEMQQILKIKAGDVEIQTITYPERNLMGHTFPKYTSEEFVLSDELKTKFLKQVYAQANKIEGSEHSWYNDGYCVKCTHSSEPAGGLTDYNDSIDCDASYTWDGKITIEAYGKLFSVEESYGVWTAFREADK